MALTKEQATQVHDTGACSELLVRAYLTSCGYETFSSDKGQARSDIIYVRGGRSIRAQVKTATFSKTGKFKYEQCRLNKAGYKGNPDAQVGYFQDEIEEIWVVGTRLWCFPIELVAGKPSLFLASDNPKPSLLRRTYDPNEFIVVMGSPERRFRDRATQSEDFSPPYLGSK